MMDLEFKPMLKEDFEELAEELRRLAEQSTQGGSRICPRIQ